MRSLRTAVLLAFALCVLSSATCAQARALLDGTVREGYPVPFTTDGFWSATWSGRTVQASGDQVSVPWRDRRPPVFEGDGVSELVWNPLPPGTALVGVMARARGSVRDERDAISRALGRRVRFVDIEERSPVGSLDLLIASDVRELDAMPSAKAWLRCGGAVAFTAANTPTGPCGFGRMVSAPTASAWTSLTLRNAVARPGPVKPAVASVGEPVARARVLLALAAFLLGVWCLGRPGRSRVIGGLVVAAGAAVIFGFTGDASWTASSQRGIWCWPGHGHDATGTVVTRVKARGAAQAMVSTDTIPGSAIVSLPRRGRVEMRGTKGNKMSWPGDGVVCVRGHRYFGDGPRLGADGRLSIGVLGGMRLTNVVLLRPGVLRALPDIDGGAAGTSAVFDLKPLPGEHLARVPESVGLLMRAMPTPPPGGALLARLRHPTLTGEHWVYAPLD